MLIMSAADIHLGNHRRFGGVEHVGLNVRCLQALAVFSDAVKAARTAGAAALVVQGDLFDYSHAEPQLIAAVQEVLSVPRGDMQVILLTGNHDEDSTVPGDHALAPLRHYATVVDAPRVIELEDNGALVELVCLPYDPAPAGEWLDKTLATLCPAAPEARPGKDSARLLAVHLGIADNETPAWLRDARDAVHVDALTTLCERHEIAACFAGNWHNHAIWEDPGFPAIVQVGALVPTGFDNPGLDELGGLATYDVGAAKFTMAFLPGPRFVKARSVPELKDLVEQGHRRGHKVYAETLVARADVPAAMAFVNEAKGAGMLQGAEVLTDPADAKAEARTAAYVARKADTLDEALSAYVAAMTVDEGVDRAAVLGRARAYLVGGRSAAR